MEPKNSEISENIEIYFKDKFIGILLREEFNFFTKQIVLVILTQSNVVSRLLDFRKETNTSWKIIDNSQKQN